MGKHFLICLPHSCLPKGIASVLSRRNRPTSRSTAAMSTVATACSGGVCSQLSSVSLRCSVQCARLSVTFTCCVGRMPVATSRSRTASQASCAALHRLSRRLRLHASSYDGIHLPPSRAAASLRATVHMCPTSTTPAFTSHRDRVIPKPPLSVGSNSSVVPPCLKCGAAASSGPPSTPLCAPIFHTHVRSSDACPSLQHASRNASARYFTLDSSSDRSISSAHSCHLQLSGFDLQPHDSSASANADLVAARCDVSSTSPIALLNAVYTALRPSAYMCFLPDTPLYPPAALTDVYSCTLGADLHLAALELYIFLHLRSMYSACCHVMYAVCK